MAYTKQNFADGNVLSAEQLNNIENGVAQNETDIQNAKEDIQTLKSPINTDLNLLVLGDSLFGTANGKEWITSLGCNTVNYAKSGASFAKVSERRYANGTYNNIYTQFDRFVTDVAAEKAAGVSPGEGTLAFHEPDIVLVDGGANDYMLASVMGTLINYPYIYNMARTYDETTVMGAMSKLFRDIAITYPKAQRFFLIPHRIYQCTEYTLLEGGYRYWAREKTYARVYHESVVTDTHPNADTTGEWKLLHAAGSRKITAAEIDGTSPIYVKDFYVPDPAGSGSSTIGNYASKLDKSTLYKEDGTLDTSKLEGGYTFDELRANIINACSMYGFKTIDLYSDSPLNVAPPTERELTESGGKWGYTSVISGNWVSVDIASSKTLNKNPVNLPNLNFFDWKGIHPTDLGYQIGYDPYVKRALSLGTKK